MSMLEQEVEDLIDRALDRLGDVPEGSVVSLPMRLMDFVYREVLMDGIPDKEMLEDSPVVPVRCLPQLFLASLGDEWGVYLERDLPSGPHQVWPLSFHIGNANVVGYHP